MLTTFSGTPLKMLTITSTALFRKQDILFLYKSTSHIFLRRILFGSEDKSTLNIRNIYLKIFVRQKRLGEDALIIVRRRNVNVLG